MENATKALMIAAAVLVVMLIIGLGIGVFNMASEQVDNAGDLSEYQIQQFNDKFRKYEGDSVSGTDVNAMIKAVFTHNQNQEDESTRVLVLNGTTPLVGTGRTGEAAFNATQSPDTVSTGDRYSVTATYDEDSGLITTMTISD